MRSDLGYIEESRVEGGIFVVGDLIVSKYLTKYLMGTTHRGNNEWPNLF